MDANVDIKPLGEDANRRAAMIEDILQELDAATLGKSRLDRVVWIISHVGEYLDRWIGAIRFYPVEMFLQNDLHSVLLIGIDIADNEVQQLENHEVFKLKWTDFSSIVRSISKASEKEIGDTMSRSLQLAIQEIVEHGNFSHR